MALGKNKKDMVQGPGGEKKPIAVRSTQKDPILGSEMNDCVSIHAATLEMGGGRSVSVFPSFFKCTV